MLSRVVFSVSAANTESKKLLLVHEHVNSCYGGGLSIYPYEDRCKVPRLLLVSIKHKVELGQLILLMTEISNISLVFRKALSQSKPLTKRQLLKC